MEMEDLLAIGVIIVVISVVIGVCQLLTHLLNG
jgi:hypothetical protein